MGIVKTSALASLLTGLVATLPSTARAETELHLVAGLAGGMSEWRGDVMAQGVVKGGLRFADWVSLYFLGRLGVGGVDQRLLTFVSAGVQVWPFGLLGGVEPYGRLSI